MNPREFFNNNPAVVTGGAALVLVLCLGLIFYQLMGGGGGGSADAKVVFYDLSNDKIMVVSALDNRFSPMLDNETAYRAIIHSCGECGKFKDGMTRQELEDAGMFIAYLMSIPTRDDAMMGPGEVMAIEYYSMEDELWYADMTQGSDNLRRAASLCEDGTNAEICNP